MHTKNQISLTRNFLYVIMMLAVLISAFSAGSLPIARAQQAVTETPTPTPTETPTTEPTATEPEGGPTQEGNDVSAQISIGSCAVVYNSNSAGGLAVRSGPGTSYTILKRISDGTVVQITGGPTSANGYTWWQHNQGGWSAGSYLADTACSGGGSGNIQLTVGLSINPSSPQIGQEVNASFKAKNNGSQSITFSNLGVKCRRVSDDASYDFQWDTNVTLSPGQEYNYSTNRSFDQAVQYWCTANYQLNGNWNDVKWPNGTTNYVYFTAQNAPAPGNLVLIQDLSVSSSNPTVGQSISGSFRVKNTGGQAITLEYLGIQGRLNGDLNGAQADFGWIQNLTLQPGQEYPYSTNRSFDTAGSWSLRPNYRVNGQWSDVHRSNGTVNTVWITVQNTPLPGQLTLIQDLSLSSTNPTINETNVTASYRVKNTGGQAITLQNLGVQVRLDGNVNSTNRDFNWEVNRTLQPGEEYAYSSSRSFDILGSWTARPNFQMNGVWSDVHRADNTVNTVWFTVQNPPPPPAGSIEIFSSLQLSPSNPTPGQSVNAQVTVKNMGGTTFTAPYFGVKGRYTSDDSDYSYGWIQNFSLAPGATYTFNGNRGFDRTGNYWFTANYQDSGGNWRDVKWANGTTNYVNLTVNSQTVTPGCFTFSTSAPNGSISRDKTGNCNGGNGYLGGTVVRLTATPNNGYAFNGWSGSATGTTNPVYVTVSGNTSVTAGFISGTSSCYTLTINSSNGSVQRLTNYNCGNNTGYTSGTTVKLTASPASGYQFTSWEGIDSNDSVTANVIMNSNKVVTANFISASLKQVVVLVHGWQGFPGSHTDDCVYSGNSPTQPKQLTETDLSFNDDYFGNLPTQLLNSQYEVWAVYIKTGPTGTPPISENAKCLAKQLEHIHNQNSSPIILIAHSMGGLVSRAYLETDMGNPKYVSKLITIGTPHTGTSLGSVACSYSLLWYSGADKASCEFSNVGMIIFNLGHPQRNPQVKYFFIGGDISPIKSPFLLYWPLLQINADGPHDGVVGLASAIGKIYRFLLPDPVVVNNAKLYSVSETHVDLPSYWTQSYFKPRNAAESSTATINCILLLLSGGDCDANAAEAQDLEATGVGDFSQPLPSQTGHLAANQTIQVVLPLDDVGQSTVQLSWFSGPVSLTLVSPQGVVINPAYAAAHPSEVTYQSGGDSNGQYAAYTLQVPQSGVYTASIIGGALGASGTDYTLSASVQSSRTLTVSTDQSFYSVGDTIVISANLAGANGIINGSSTQAHIDFYDGTAVDIPLFDIGGGTYQGSSSVSDTPGLGLVTVTAQGSDAGVAYARQSSVDFMISPSNVSLAGQYSDGISDLDGDGLYDNLNVAVGVSASLAQGAETSAASVGDYTVSADLVDNNGNVVAHAVTETTFGTGESNVVLPFNGDDIRASGTSGPYELTNVTIVDQQTSAPAVWNAADVWTTGTYNSQNFSASCFVLDVNISGNGSVSANPLPNCNNGLQYAAGTVVTLTAQGNSGDAFTHWDGDVDSASSVETVTVNQDLDTTAHFNPSNSVFVVNVFTAASAQAASLSVNTEPSVSNNNDLQSASIEGYYNAGDTIDMFIRTQNTVGTNATAYFQWSVTDPQGQNVDIGWEGDLSTWNGVADWYLTRSLPVDAVTGLYMFTGSITYNGHTSSQSSTFHVTAITLSELAITDISSYPSSPFTNDNVWFYIDVTNLSSVDASGFWVDFYVDDTPIGCQDWAAYYDRSSGLTTQATKTFKVRLPANSLTAGAHQFRVFVDSGCEVTESNESNNISTATAFSLTAPSSLPPAHDDFDASRLVATIPYNDTVTVSGATTALDDPSVSSCNLAPGTASVWYKYTPSSNLSLNLDTFGSDYDTYIAAWSGSRGNLNPVGCNDDSGGLQSLLQVNLTAGTTYYFEVAQYSDSISASATSLAVTGASSRPLDAGILVSQSQKPESDVSAQAGGTLNFHVSSLAPILIYPAQSQDIETNYNPTFQWNKVAAATYYRLYVSGPSGLIDQWYESANICNTTTCSVASPTMLGGGAHVWYVQTWSPAGYGPWSNNAQPTNFNTTIIIKPPAAVLTAPIGNIGTNYNPTYTWNKVSSATWYHLYVSGPSGIILDQWYQAVNICNTTTCSVTSPTLLGGAHAWYVQTYNSAGYGPWSNNIQPTNFNTTIPPLPGAATNLSPNTAIGTNYNPTYTWNKATDAVYYELYVRGPKGVVLDQWYLASSICNATTCSVASSTPLGGGAHAWYVQTWNSTGYGPWSNNTQPTNFSTTIPTIPVAAVLTAPSGTIANHTPTYTWNKVNMATWYRLYVSGPGGVVKDQWYQAASICNATTCSVVSPTLPSGAHAWYVQAYNVAGYSPWASSTFTVNP